MLDREIPLFFRYDFIPVLKEEKNFSAGTSQSGILPSKY